MKVRDGRPGGHDDDDRQSRLDGEAQRQEPPGALVDPDVKAQEPLALVFRGRERERLRPRAGAQNHIPQTTPGKLVEEGYGKRGSRRFTPRTFHRPEL